MNIPKKVKIGALVYDVKKEKGLSASTLQMGECNTNSTSIKLDTNYPEQVMFGTFLHEVFHAISDVYAIGLDERQILMLEAGFYAFYKDNPKVFERSK